MRPNAALRLGADPDQRAHPLTTLDYDFSRALSAALAAGPQQLIALMNAQFLALPGVRNVTWLAVAPDKSVTHRIGTSDSTGFPIGGFDPIDNGPWCKRIFGDKRAVVGNSPAGMAEFIPETEDLVKMGYGATMCTPIVINGEVAGTVNMLGDEGFLTEGLIASVETLLPLAALIFAVPGIYTFNR